MEKERKQREFKKITPDIDFEDFEDDFVDTGSHRERRFFFLSPSFIIIAGIGGFTIYFLVFKSQQREDFGKDN
jgi:hypothetical protein